MKVSSLNWIGFDVPSSGEFRAEVQHRYHCVPAPVTVRVSGDEAVVDFDEPEQSVTSGQGAAFYAGDQLLGGGWIASTTRDAQAAHAEVGDASGE